MSIGKELAEECAEELARRLAERSHAVSERPDLAALAVVLYLGEIADSLAAIAADLKAAAKPPTYMISPGATVSLDDGAFVEINPQGEDQNDEN